MCSICHVPTIVAIISVVPDNLQGLEGDTIFFSCVSSIPNVSVTLKYETSPGNFDSFEDNIRPRVRRLNEVNSTLGVTVDYELQPLVQRNDDLILRCSVIDTNNQTEEILSTAVTVRVLRECIA